MSKLKIMIVGMGNRGLSCFAKGLLGWNADNRHLAERAQIVAVVDGNLARAQTGVKELKVSIPAFRTITEAQAAAPAEWAIITTPDFTHKSVVLEALEAGLNVMVDKPLATSAWECDQIIAAMKRTGRKVIVGHNMRYNAAALAAAKLVRSGRIGPVISFEAAEILDYSHGGDYFHRWHSDFSKSAGLMNHKCSHHLDVLCWILDDETVEVSARGGRSFYVPRPDLNHGERCSECNITKECPHFYDMDKWDGIHRRMYKDCEGEDGYKRDLCVFSDRHTINDHETATLRMSRGTIGSFTLQTFAPREFWYFYFTGTKGRLEVGLSPVDAKPYVRLTGADKKVEDIVFEREAGEHGHGNADIQLMEALVGIEGGDPLQRATPEEARRAVLVADLCARSIARGGAVVKASEAGKDRPPAPPN